MADPRHHTLQACAMSLYPAHDSLIEAVQYIEAQAPIQPHEIFPLLMRYHNTLIQELQRDLPAPQGTPQLRRVK